MIEEISNIEIQNPTSNERSYATGKRKNSIARVWLKKGSGQILINGKKVSEYFSRPVLQMIVNQPLEINYLIILSNSASSKNFSKISSSRAHVLIIFDCFTASLSKLSDSSTSFNAALLLAFA